MIHYFFLLLGLLSLISTNIHAGGVFLYEISSADARLASAGWSARADAPSTVFTNPAGMTRLCDRQLEFGLQPIFAHIKFDPNSKTMVEGSKGRASTWLPSGSFYYVQPLSDKLTVGLGSLGYFGSDLVYNHHWVGRYYVQKVLLEGLSCVPAVAYKINEQWSIGLGANVMYGFFKQRSAVRNSLDNLSDGYLSFHDNRFGCGGVFGILYQPTCQTRFGLQYLTEVQLDFRLKPKFGNIGPNLRAALDRLRLLKSKIKLDVNVPQSVMFSAYHDLNESWSFMGNVGWQQWSRFQRITLSLHDFNSISSKIKFQDTWHVALGTEWRYSEQLSLTAGAAYDSSAISNSQRNLDFPIGNQWRVGTGGQWRFSDRLFVDFGAELQWQGDLPVSVNLGPLARGVSGKFKNTYALFFDTSITYAF